jgi:hypothetical protein
VTLAFLVLFGGTQGAFDATSLPPSREQMKGSHSTYTLAAERLAMAQQVQLITSEARTDTESLIPNTQRVEDLTSQASQLLQRASFLKLRAVARCDARSQAPIQHAGNGIGADSPPSTYPRPGFMSLEASSASSSVTCSEDGDCGRERARELASSREPSPLAFVSTSDTELNPRGTKNYLTVAWTDRGEQVAKEPALEHVVVPKDEPRAAHVTETSPLVRFLPPSSPPSPLQSARAWV